MEQSGKYSALLLSVNPLLPSHQEIFIFSAGASPSSPSPPPAASPTPPQPGVTPTQPQGAVAVPAMHPALAAINPAVPGLPPQNGQTFQFPRPPPGSAVPQVQGPFFFPGMQQLANRGPPLARRPGKPSKPGYTGDRKQCNCKNSKCLKLYCECFASGRYCDGCNCNNCFNNRQHEDKRQAAVESILDRNPNAFRPKIADGADEGIVTAPARHNKGCNCKKSNCLKKYCECFQAGIVCSENCKCIDCKNFDGSTARAVIVAHNAKHQVPLPGILPRPATLGGLPGVRSSGVGAGASLYPKAEPAVAAAAAAAMGPAMSQGQLQQAAKEALREVVSGEVIDKLAMLLVMLSNEEADKRANAGEVDDPNAVSEAMGSHGTPRRLGLYEEQEKLVLTEFRDTLRTINRVITDKVEKRSSEANAKQAALAQALATQHAHVQAVQHAQAHAQAQAAAHAVVAAGQAPGQGQPQLFPRGAVPPGMQPVYLMHNGRPQLVLLPQGQAMLAQQMAQQQQMAVAAAQQQQQQQQHVAQYQALQQQALQHPQQSPASPEEDRGLAEDPAEDAAAMEMDLPANTD